MKILDTLPPTGAVVGDDAAGRNYTRPRLMCWFLVVSGEGGEPRLVRDASVAKTGEMRPCRQYAAGNATCHEKRSTSVDQGSFPPTFLPAIPPLCLASRGWRAPSLPAFASISLGTKLGAPRPSHVESPTFRWNLRRRHLPRPVSESVRRSRYSLDSRSRGRRRA